MVYPALLTPYEDETGGYLVEFPDLQGGVTGGEDMAEALFMAEDAASGWILTELEDGNTSPIASAYGGIKAEVGQIVSLIAMDMDGTARSKITEN